MYFPFKDFLHEYDQFTLATTYFDLKEYDRAGYFLEDCASQKCYFLYMYSRYLADEKRKLDKASDSIGKFKKNLDIPSESSTKFLGYLAKS